MKQLIIHGDPGIRKGAIIDYDEEELVCFGINRNGEWHGPDQVQLWCTVGTADEYEDYEKRNYTPHFLDVDRVDAEAVDVVRAKADLAI
ncbi:HAH_0734 family protein [Natronorubrum sp. FCH18a]|uniref:HAH_0734 family protein n=1 Tax=Natronorubrum sp. FCH18a TaxID=3447018 RepID=UPI003F516CDE